MAEQVFPTKGNLMNIKKSLSLAQLGFELMDKKRNILIRELMSLVEQAKEIRGSVEDTYKEAYQALQTANIINGVINDISGGMTVDDSLSVTYRSVMGCEIPRIKIAGTVPTLNYGFMNTDSFVDKAYICFDRAKKMTVKLAEIENSVYRLTNSIRKTQTRANALQNIVIPRYQEQIKFITVSLEEKEREEFSRMKVIKSRKIR